MKINSYYERTQVKAGFEQTLKYLEDAKTYSDGASTRTNFGESGSEALREVNEIFHEVSKLTNDAYWKLKEVENYL